jgi:hypothetical protein
MIERQHLMLGMNSKKSEKILFFSICFNCCLILIFTTISIATEQWVKVNPYRSIDLNNNILVHFNNNDNNDTHSNDTIKSDDNFDKQFLIAISSASIIDDDGNIIFIDDTDNVDLYNSLNCPRYTGTITFGLFRGTWILYHGLGCKNRRTRVSSLSFKFKFSI